MRAPASVRPLGGAGRVALVCLLAIGTILATIDALTLVFYLSYASVGAYVLIRRPHNVIGWLLVGIAFGFITTTTPPDVDAAALLRGDATLRDTFVTWIGGWGGWATFVGFLALTIVVPNGRFPEAGGRRLSVILLSTGVAGVVLSAVAPSISISPDGVTNVYFPNPVAVLPDLPVWSVLHVAEWGGLIILIPLAIGVVRMVIRYRASRGVERQQLRWLVTAVAFAFVAVLTGLISLGLFGDAIGGAAWIPAIVAYPTIPLAIGVAVMRYRLFEIDRILSRTIGWGLVTGCLVTVFSGGVIALQTALAGFTQGATLAVAASTLVALALFQPIRRRVQRAVDRRFDRARYDGEQTAAAFAVRLRDQVDLAALETDFVATISTTVRPTAAGIWLRAASRDQAHTSAP